MVPIVRHEKNLCYREEEVLIKNQNALYHPLIKKEIRVKEEKKKHALLIIYVRRHRNNKNESMHNIEKKRKKKKQFR